MNDGLLLNIDLEEESGSVKRVKKGGKWTDRAKSNKAAKRKERANDTESTSDLPSKRSRVDVPTPSISIPRKNTTVRPSGQVISSLFTSNPTIEVDATSTAIKKTAQLPSNAPLVDASSFECLGLNPLLVAHLQDKLGIDKPTSIQRAALGFMLHQGVSESRDLFIQSQTGSGKTLSFLLPLIHDLLPLSSLSYIDRSIGTLAIIIAPTRELAKQISDVLESLLQLRMSVRESERSSEDSGPRLTRWLVSGLLTGGATRSHEKAKLRKGIPILVSTPGRLLDHLQNTESLRVAKCRWLVFDEADRLMELGFQETLEGIVRCLDGRRNLALNAAKEGGGLAGEVIGGWDWGVRRRNILCSATIREDVQKLAGITLSNPLVIKGSTINSKDEPIIQNKDMAPDLSDSKTKFTPPSQLSQKYVVVPLKLRLVSLVAMLRSILAKSHSKQRAEWGTKVIVFLSCTDSVDFHWELLGGVRMSRDGAQVSGGESADEVDIGEGGNAKEAEAGQKKSPKSGRATPNAEVATQSSLLPNTLIFRLHGSLPLLSRQAAIKGFSIVPTPGQANKSTNSSSSSILLCTSVASRGLDLPSVTTVIQYDLPTEGGADEYVHRVGRTARVGKGGEAWSFVTPEEIAWVEWVEDNMDGEKSEKQVGTANAQASQLVQVQVNDVMSEGFGGKGSEFEDRATEVQLAFERWVLSTKPRSDMAQKAYLSHMRAYMTHPTNEKHIFHIRNLHLGHLAKAFALRDAPSNISASTAGGKKRRGGKAHNAGAKREDRHGEEEGHRGSTEARMKAAVRNQGRLSKKLGQLVNGGADEFQVAAGGQLEKLVGRS